MVRRDESSQFWRGMVNRWNNALAAAKTFQAEKPAQTSGAGMAAGAGVVTAVVVSGADTMG